MSDLDTAPDVTNGPGSADDHAVATLWEPRSVPLGGLRAMEVERVLPQRGLPTVGAWCFLDEFGPADLDMRILPHPHIGLQTVTWPLAGEIRHRDSLGTDVLVRPGQLNLMTAGHGVSHSEMSVSTGVLYGLQLWVALPAKVTTPAFEQHVSLPIFTVPGVTATVFIGAIEGAVSPATTHTPLVGADVTVTEDVALPLNPDFEHAILALTPLTAAGVDVPRGHLLYLGTGRTSVDVTAGHAILLGGEPFADDLVMWWNFVGRDHDEIAQARADWQAGHPRFGTVAGHGGDRIPAPDLPSVRLTPRTRNPTQSS